MIEVPLLRESETYVNRLIAGVSQFSKPVFYHRRQVNWSHKFLEDYFLQEAGYFRKNVDNYLKDADLPAPAVQDVFSRTIGRGLLLNVVLKVFSHWLFGLVGSLQRLSKRNSGFTTYRKCYVDDMELVFDDQESGVLRAIFPFPLGVYRQLKYIQFLHKRRYPLQFDGNPYRLFDFLGFLYRRDIASLARLEIRAQLLLAKRVSDAAITTIQLSDEFDIGSLEFSRYASRRGIKIINSAHGVGKYLPYHRYDVFHVLTRKQRDYYKSIGPCHYYIRDLNDPMGHESQQGVLLPNVDTKVHLIWLSQVCRASGDVVANAEVTVLNELRRCLSGKDKVALYYKPHPNKKGGKGVDGFFTLSDLNAVNGRKGTIFASFYSTCQIDPKFKGRKVLVRQHLIRPEIIFDDCEKIVNIDGLIQQVYFLEEQVLCS